jgi:hypothetical protein
MGRQTARSPPDLPRRGDGHLNHVYGKVGVGSRTAKVATARVADRID